MKKQLIILCAVAGLALGASSALAGTANGSGIVGSKHDMNRQAGTGVTAETKGRVCAFCHTPHHKIDSSALDYNPLWSHDTNNDTSWIPYASATFTETLQPDPLTGPSRLCMSCHDGVIAVDQHYGIAGSATSSHLTGDNFGEVAVGLGNDLSNDHPIGFSIEDALTKSGTTAALNTTLVTTNNPKISGKLMTDLGFKGLVTGTSIFTCASCHDVHNKDNVDDAFLYEKQAGSQFCLMCHNK